MATDKESMAHARECVWPSGLTDDRNVRDQLIDLARGWMAASLRGRRSDVRVLTQSAGED